MNNVLWICDYELCNVTRVADDRCYMNPSDMAADQLADGIITIGKCNHQDGC